MTLIPALAIALQDDTAPPDVVGESVVDRAITDASRLSDVTLKALVDVFCAEQWARVECERTG